MKILKNLKVIRKNQYLDYLKNTKKNIESLIKNNKCIDCSDCALKYKCESEFGIKEIKNKYKGKLIILKAIHRTLLTIGDEKMSGLGSYYKHLKRICSAYYNKEYSDEINLKNLILLEEEFDRIKKDGNFVNFLKIREINIKEFEKENTIGKKPKQWYNDKDWKIVCSEFENIKYGKVRK